MPLFSQGERAVVEDYQLIGYEPFHELRESLVPGLVKDEAVGMELSHRQRATLLGEKREQTSTCGRNVRCH